jgi:hypothetical protein
MRRPLQSRLKRDADRQNRLKPVLQNVLKLQN